ncbi:MAG: hypothetical protein HeimC3_54460 [Candidatus Heimdallarchaeota archaeon LC_3]|nr:MAG: hypothetical protein HeimC3_54460 [Candidatus Heimdallarchaeota archaeon LC_3]
MSSKKVKDAKNEASYGPDKRTLYIGLAIFLVGTFIFSQFLIFVTALIIDNTFSLEEVIQVIINDPITIILGIILLLIGAWLSASGAEAITITNSYLEHKKFLSTTVHYWKEKKDDFTLLIRSSQPTIKGRKGLEAWQVEIQFIDKKNDGKSRISIPSISNEKEVVLLIRNIRRIVKAEPVGRRDVNEKLITGKNQKISFKIDRNSVKDLSRRKKKEKS